MHLSHLSIRGFRGAQDEDPTEVSIPGRFSVLIGANGAGKTTACDALLLAHRRVFTSSRRISASTLGSRPRGVAVRYSFESAGSPEGALGVQLQELAGHDLAGQVAGEWERGLVRDLGNVRAEQPTTSAPLLDQVRLVHLPATRNPLDELARREARVLVELLRAQQQRISGTRSLRSLRERASALLASLTADGLISEVEGRIDEHLRALSAGVSRKWPYVREQIIDDQYLARVLELMLAALEGRGHARPLDVAGLGYVNLLHIAVTLAAIPDLGATPSAEGGPPGHTAVDQDGETEEPAVSPESEETVLELHEASDHHEAEDDSFFSSDAFHATVVIEEPEAHLHPQLQHSLLRYLRRITALRPELQMILSTHASDIVSGCHPDEIVVFRRLRDVSAVARTIAHIPIDGREEVVRRARLHLDATRSAALLAERLAIVEGVTDAALLREFAYAWAADDIDKAAFADAVSIVAIGNRIGPWPVRLLATREHEIASRLAVLADTDSDGEVPDPPAWLGQHDPEVVKLFRSHPTLEPSVAPGNEPYVSRALETTGLDLPEEITPDSIREIFRGRSAGEHPRPAGPGAGRKADFALALADEIAEALRLGQPVMVPEHFADLFEWLYTDTGLTVDDSPTITDEAAAADP